ncbi:MAG: hypothetical protein ACLFWL_17690 [Candidatus Brocadiia bacterium]
MTERPDWLPDQIHFDDYGGNWPAYVEALYDVFKRDFIHSRPQFRGADVACQTGPLDDGKEPAFWHIIQQKEDEERKPDMRRCERIAWPRAVLEHADDPRVAVWRTQRRGEERFCVWYGEQYLVVLGDRGDYYFFITAYPTNRKHTCRKLRKDRDRSP